MNQADKLILIKLMGGRCLGCKTRKDLSIDHIKPSSLGGKDVISNMQVLCRPCNSIKSNMVIDFRTGVVPKMFKDRLVMKCPTCFYRSGGYLFSILGHICRLCGTQWKQEWGVKRFKLIKVPSDWQKRLANGKEKQRISMKKSYAKRQTNPHPLERR